MSSTISLFFCFCLSGSARVWVDQGPSKQHYRAGETAEIYCSLHTDQSDVEGYIMEWVIFDSENKGKDLSEATIYRRHAKVDSNKTSSKLTLEHLTTNHTDMIVCAATFLENGVLVQLLGNGTILQISHATQIEVFTAHSTPPPPPSLSWINYLLVAVNILIFSVGTAICVTVVHHRWCRK